MQPNPSLEFNDAGLTAFLANLVRAPSPNPPGNEGLVAELMVTRLAGLGFETITVEAAPGRPSVVARLVGTGGGATLLFNGHMDVQPPGRHWSRDPFGATIEGRRLYGQGAMDMKAGLAATVYAVDSLQQAGLRLAGDIVITAVADEVCGGHLGTGFLISEGLVQADMAVVCEPTGDTVRVAHRGALWLEIEVTGKSAHGGRPWLGVNAVSKAARIIAAIEDQLVPSLQDRVHPLLPAPTINIGAIRGGTKFNLVADHVVFQLDRRLVPGEDADTAEAEVSALCTEICAADDDEWSVDVKRAMHVSPGEVDPDERIVRACREAHRKVTGEDAAIGSTAGFEDAHFLLDAGIPTAMYGPYRRTASGEDPHYTISGMADEFVDLDDVARATRIYAQLMIDLLEKPL
ncbi:MAG: M20 family metallopeptidase [Hyphomicrobiaceae bacterium]|nr:M20 family metallopeptidase [Hyphomicrobiaceae bacterium]